MSGLVQWTSRAKRKPVKGSKPNAQRQRVLASRRRKERERAAKLAVRMPTDNQ